MSNKIRVISTDMDGCFMSDTFLGQEVRDIIKANETLLQKIISKKKYDKTILNLGSNRQSIALDYENSKKRREPKEGDEQQDAGIGSAFPQMQALADHLGAEFDPFLLADLFNDLPEGHSIKLAKSFYNSDGITYKKEVLDKERTLPGWINDPSKVSILYAQMHRAALKHPKDEISFTFFDDREDLRAGLHAYFKKNAHLIPANVKLKIRGYEGAMDLDGEHAAIKKYEPIHGIKREKSIDKNYRQTVKAMAKAAIESDDTQESGLSDYSCNLIRSYSDAEKAGFHATGSLDYSKYYNPKYKPTLLTKFSANMDHFFGSSSKKQEKKKSKSVDERALSSNSSADNSRDVLNKSKSSPATTSTSKQKEKDEDHETKPSHGKGK